jgi:hypothetical protein
LPASYVSLHTCFPCAEYFAPDAYAQDSQHNSDFDPDTLTDKVSTAG